MGKGLKKTGLSWFTTQAGKRCIWGIVFLIPIFLVLAIFQYFPIIQCIIQSFFQYRITDLPGTFVGLDNYKAVFSSSLFYTYFKNTVVLYAFNMLFAFFVPILQALMLFQLTKSRGFFRYLYIFPTGITALAGLSVWKYVWEPEGGIANFITEAIGLGKFEWLYDERTVKFCLRFPGILGGGMAVVLYLVTMNNISSEHFEAARIDGANSLQILKHIILPGIKGMVQIQLLLSLTGSLLAFEDVYMMTQGGPGYSSTTLVLGAYTKAFKEQNFGVAMAMAVVILVCTVIITSLVNYFVSRKED
ncbi:MAG: sugar ABC transporter permease [Oscillospiraceae bacterium]|nr:sugar ABC transporter permease [Oscillospiraceae bacterium]